jgi:hypothetical protein
MKMDCLESNSSRYPIRSTCKSWIEVGIQGVCRLQHHHAEENPHRKPQISKRSYAPEILRTS